MSFDNIQLMMEKIFFDKAKRPLKKIEIIILEGAYHGKKYSEISQEYCCTPEYIKHDAAPKLWKLISKMIGEKVGKKNFRLVVESTSFKNNFIEKAKDRNLELVVATSLKTSLSSIFEVAQRTKSSALERQSSCVSSYIVPPINTSFSPTSNIFIESNAANLKIS